MPKTNNTGELTPRDSLDQLPISPEITQEVGEAALRQADWLRNSEASRRVRDMAGRTGVTAAGYQEGYEVNAVPDALPIGWREHRVGDDGDRMRPWGDMSEDERALYVDPSNAATLEGDAVPFDQLLPEVQQTLLARRLFDIHSKSQDPQEIQAATERNTKRVHDNEVFQPGDLAHTTTSDALPHILQTGLIARELLGEEKHHGTAVNWPYNAHFTRLETIPTGPIEKSDYNKLLATTDRYANDICLIVDRSSPGVTDIGREIDPTSTSMGIQGHTLVFGGVPSTEIAAICVLPPPETLKNANGQGEHTAQQAKLSAIDTVLAHGQYIAVFDHEGNLALTRQEFDQRRAAGDYGNFVAEPFVPPPNLTRTPTF